MQSRKLALGFGLGLTFGLLSFGCVAGMQRPSAAPDRAPAAASAIAPPVPAPPIWIPANGPAAVASPNPVPAAVAQASKDPPPRAIATNEPVPATAVPAAQVPVPAQPPVQPVAVTAADGSARIRELYRLAAQSYASIDSYVARLRRREIVGSEAKPEELLTFKFRKQPWSVYFKWLGPEAKGREAIYVKGQYDNKLHTLLAAGDMPLMPAGNRFSISPDSILVKSRSRHMVTEAGIGNIVERIGQRLQAENADPNKTRVRYLGQVKRPEYEAPMEGIEETIAPGSELPGGGTRQVFFDSTSHLPVLLITRDAQGRELEYYAYDRLQYPVKLDDDDFNPDKLWPAKN
jgi:hypothetical protein